MKRWQIIFDDGYRMTWYADTKEQTEKSARLFGNKYQITSYEDDSYMEYVNHIQKIGQLKQIIKRNNEQREIYECDCFLGKMLVRISKDLRDNIYYDYTEYQIWKSKRILEPILWTMSNPTEVDNLLTIKPMQYEQYSFRKYGQPKLDKPKELKNVKAVGSAVFVPKKCNPQIFLKDNDVWIKHTDYFSNIWRPPVGERTDMPLSYYANKYFGKSKKEKFIYADNWAGIVLRNEAWLCIRDLIPLCNWREINDVQIAQMILDSQKEKLRFSDIDLEWERFWENVVKVVRKEIK